MPTPEFIRELRTHIGTAELWVPAVRGVVLRRTGPEPEVLLVRRSDSGRWTVTSGILDPGEQPADGAVREIYEETAVIARAVRVAGVFATRLVEYPHGDRCRYLDTVLEMAHVSGEPRVNDEESTEVGWFPVSELPTLQSEDQRLVIGWALDADAPAQMLTEAAGR